ncbi:MAG: hypothetical protein IVW53_07380 [Chloroflexi bacterium]|nr:hypothetical protein [Chloroflexota bacterium]
MAVLVLGCSNPVRATSPPTSAITPNPSPVAHIEAYAVAYDAVGPTLVTLLADGSIGERRRLGYDPVVAVTPEGIFVAALDPQNPRSDSAGGRLSMLPFIGPDPAWTIGSAPSPVAVDGPVARWAATSFAGSVWYESSILDGSFYKDSLVSVDPASRRIATIALDGCGVGQLLAFEQVHAMALVCAAPGRAWIIAGGQLGGSLPLGAYDIVAAASTGRTAFVTASQLGLIDVHDLEQRVTRVWDFSPLRAVRDQLQVAGGQAAVGLESAADVSAGGFTRVGIVTLATASAVQFGLDRPATALALTPDGILIASTDGCVRLYSRDGRGSTAAWCGVTSVAQLLVLPPGR